VAQRNYAQIAAGLVLVATVLSSRGAAADERTEARVHFKRGMAQIGEGHYDTGIAELKRAYEILPHPNVLYNIARAYVDVGDLENAVLYYKIYVGGAPKDRDEVAQVVASLEARIRRQQAQLVEAQQAQVVGVPQGPGAGIEPGGAVKPVPGAAAGAQAAPLAGVVKIEGGALKTEQVFEETVVTASRAAQSPLDAPNSTSIITEQDIRLSGITKIPELLRRLAGVDIMEVTGAQTEVSLRGFNQRLSNKVLVLVDGRSVYIDLLGATLWAAVSISVEDIERIEVVRGPGSALYGADAFNGVINIITKAPGTAGTGFNAGYGGNSSAHGTVWTSGRDAETAYRISAGYEYMPRWSRQVSPTAKLNTAIGDQDASMKTARVDVKATRQIGNDTTVGLQGGYLDGFFEILGEGPITDQIITGNVTDLMAFMQSKHVELRAFWNHNTGSNSNNAAPPGQSLLPAVFVNDTVDGEAQYIAGFETGHGANHDLHLGATYRLKQVRWSYQTEDQSENHVGLFLHDEVKLGERFAIVGDYRADYVPYLSRIVQSPRGSVLVHPSKRSTIRAIVGTAFRTPTFLESYIGNFIQLPIAGGGENTPAVHPKLEPEQIFTTELGYLNSESDYFTFDSALFYNHVTNLIDIRNVVPITIGDFATGQVAPGVDPSTGYYPLFFGGFENQCQQYNVIGAELGARVFPVEGLDVFANYTLMDVAEDQSRCSQEQKNLIVADSRTSAHKVNAGVQLRSKSGVDGEVDFHYVSEQDWAEQVIDVQQQRIVYQSFHLDPYALLNARVGYRFLHNHAEVSVVGFNVLDTQHREHPAGQLIGRQVMGFLTYRF
jgi:outer membrane receptor for ferrienterochelin and colicin